MAGAVESGVVHEFVAQRPAPELRHVIDRYVGYRLLGLPGGLHRGMPSTNMTFIASIDRPIDVVAQTDPTQSPRRYGTVVGGLHSSAALVAHDGNQEGVAVQMTPLGFRMLFGMPGGELSDLVIELTDLAGPVSAELRERLHGLAGWPQRFAACDDVLTRVAGATSRTAASTARAAIDPELRRSWDLLVRSSGRLPVSAVADDVGYSRQHLRRRFRAEFGLSPKQLARVARFERARRMLASVPPFVSVGHVAAACGYYDQAHLCRDFAELAGCTPTGYLREEAPFVQDRTLPDGHD